MQFPDILDATMMAEARACKQKFFNSHIRHLAPTGTSHHLKFGGAVAAGLEAGRNSYFLENSPTKGNSRAAYEATFNAALAYWGNYRSPQDETKNEKSLLTTLDGYLHKWPFGIDPLVPAFPSGKGVEFSFAEPLPIEHPDKPGQPLYYGGRFDMFGRADKLLYICDEKTTGGSFGHGWSESWKMRGQFHGYVWAATINGYKPDGVLVRGLKVTKTQPPEFIQDIIVIADFMVERWYQQLLRDVTALVHCYKQQYFDYNFGETCTSYGNCAFIPLCTAKEPENWFSLYQTRVWNPLHKDPVAAEATAA